MELWLLACWDCKFESHRGHGFLFLISVVCCQVVVSESGWSLVQRSPTECSVCACDHEVSIMRRPWPTTGCCTMGSGDIYIYIYLYIYLCVLLSVPWTKNRFAVLGVMRPFKYSSALRMEAESSPKRMDIISKFGNMRIYPALNYEIF